MFPGSYCVDQMQNAQRVYLSRDCSSSIATSLRLPRPLRVRGPSNRRRLLRQGACVWSLSQDSDGLSLSSLEGTKCTTNEPVVSTAVEGPTSEVISPADAGAAVQDTLKSVTGTDTLLADIYHSLEGSGQPQPRRRHQQPDYVENLSEDATVTESKGSGSGLGAVLALAIPALGSVLADPLMSLVDTGCVGQVSSLQLAALGPNTAVFNLIFQVFAFLGVATTNVLATNSLHAPGISAEEQHRRKEVSQKMLCYALTIAAACGTAVACVLEVWGAPLLTAVGTSAEMLPPALAYLRIRALASPAVMVMCVAQGACLGQQDAWTPLKVFAAAGVLNLVGDAYLILQAGMGITGAAVATSAAQYMGAAYFLWYLQRQGRRKGGVALKWHGLPKFETLQPFVGVAVTLLSRTAFTMAAFTSITAAATTMGTLSTAAHQVALQVFWFLSFVPEPLSMTAQSLIARDRTDPSKVRSMAYLLLKLGAMVGLGLGLAMAGIFYGCPWLFTSDASVMAAIMPLTAQGMLAIGFCSLTMMCDGVSIGSGDFAHLPRTNFVGMMVTGSTLYAMAQANAGLPGVWWALAAFFMARLVQHGVHAAMNWRASAFGQYQPGLLAAAA